MKSSNRFALCALVLLLACGVSQVLASEAIANELVHHVQQARKSLDLRYEQRIRLNVVGDEGVGPGGHRPG